MVPSPVGFQIGPAGQGGFHPYHYVVRSSDWHIHVVAGLDTSGLNKYTSAHQYVSEMAGWRNWNGFAIPV